MGNTNKEATAWTDVSQHNRLMLSNSRDAIFAKNFMWQPTDDGNIFRQHYTEAPDPYSIMPKKLIDMILGRK